MYPNKRLDMRELSSSQSLNSQPRITQYMNSQNLAFQTNMVAGIYDGSVVHQNTPVQGMNMATRQLPLSQYGPSVPANTSLRNNQYRRGGDEHFLNSDAGRNQRSNPQMSMANTFESGFTSNNFGYGRLSANLMNPMSQMQMQQLQNEPHPYGNILTENSQILNTGDQKQRQPVNLMNFETLSSQNMTGGSSSRSFISKYLEPTPASTAMSKLTSVGLQPGPEEKKRNTDKDYYEWFNLIGSVEQIIRWNQMAKNKKCFINYELHGFLQSITEESPNVATLWIKQEPQSGPIIQGIYCQIDRRLSDKIFPGTYIVCYGRMLKTKIMQVFNVTADNALDIGYKRISFLCQRSLQEFTNDASSVTKCS